MPCALFVSSPGWLATRMPVACFCAAAQTACCVQSCARCCQLLAGLADPQARARVWPRRLTLPCPPTGPSTAKILPHQQPAQRAAEELVWQCRAAAGRSQRRCCPSAALAAARTCSCPSLRPRPPRSARVAATVCLTALPRQQSRQPGRPKKEMSPLLTHPPPVS
jgi:hypothetical protein